MICSPFKRFSQVAPLAGSVDRNKVVFGGNISIPTSLPSRGAWIEIIPCLWMLAHERLVAPLAGSVDRNQFPRGVRAAAVRRSPRGERG